MASSLHCEDGTRLDVRWAGSDAFASPRLARASDGARLQEYGSARDSVLAVAILEGRIDEREVPRYSQRMTAKGIVSTSWQANQNDVNREGLSDFLFSAAVIGQRAGLTGMRSRKDVTPGRAAFNSLQSCSHGRAKASLRDGSESERVE